MSQFNQQFITAIIDRYGLEPDDDHIDHTVAAWLDRYDRAWIVKAIVESLHRGRYKIKSVDSILIGWQRVGKPSYKFTPEFEREILQNLPGPVELVENLALPILSTATLEPTMTAPSLSSEQLNPEESAPFLHHDHWRSNSIHALRASTAALGSSSMDLQTEDLSRQGDDFEAPTIPLVAVIGGIEPASKNWIQPQPAKFQLFHTLRAIVEPHQPQLSDNHSPISEHLQQGEKISWNGCFGTDEFA